MGYKLAPFSSLLIANFIILVCFGLQGILIPLRGGIENFSATLLGIIGGAYYAGYFWGAIHCPKVVQRSGHIRSFAVFASLASITPLVHAIFPNEYVWIALRVLSGYCFAGLILVIESWLNEQVDNENRGRLFGTYLMVTLLSLILAQLSINLASPATMTLFILTSILASLALLPVSLPSTTQPPLVKRAKLDLKVLWSISPVGLVGCFVVGITNGPLWTLGPVYALDAGLDFQGVSFFMAIIIIGGAVVQWPIGRLSDLTDRRWIIIFLCTGASIAGFILVMISGMNSFISLLGVAFVFGAFSLTLYSVCVALINDNAQGGDFVVISSGLLLVYGIGAFLGPMIVSVSMLYLGTDAVFLFTATVQGVFTLFVLFRISVEPAMPAKERSNFAVMSVSQTVAKPLELDPRAETKVKRKSPE